MRVIARMKNEWKRMLKEYNAVGTVPQKASEKSRINKRFFGPIFQFGTKLYNFKP